MSRTGAPPLRLRRRALAVGLALGLATPAAAQVLQPPQGSQRPGPSQSPTLAADRAAIIECLRQSAASPTACIGSVAVACVRAAGPNRSDTEQACARREEAVWRERLNQVLQLTARPLDAGQRSRLAALHLSWESYVAQKCAFYRAGQAASVQMGRQAGCELREVALRTLELQRGLPQARQRRPQQPPSIIR
jgi:uncharacterized protein YecT (DUF1311 family)